MILRGNDFWNAYNGMLEAKNNGVSTDNYDVFASLEETCSAVFQNMLKKDGLRYTEEELEDKISSQEANILGSTGANPNYYLSRKTKGLKASAISTIEGNSIAYLEINSRKPSQEQSKGLRKIA